MQLTGDVVHRDVKAEDVTDQYVELETRLKNARAIVMCHCGCLSDG